MCGWRKRKSWLFGLKRRSVSCLFHPSSVAKELLMALTQGGFQAYDFNRMVVLFTMMNDKTEVPCAPRRRRAAWVSEWSAAFEAL